MEFRNCDDVNWGIKYRYFYNFTGLLPGSVEDASAASCDSFDPTTILNTGDATPWATYQWEVSTNGSSWTDVSGATDVSYNPPIITETTYYRRRVNDCNSRTAYSNVVTYIIGAASTPYTELTSPASTDICNGESIMLEVGGGMDGSGATTIWYDDAGLTNEVATGNPFTTAALTASQSYYVIRTDDCGTTAAFQVDVNVEDFPTPYDFLVSPNPAVACINQTATIEVSGGNGSATTATNWYSDAALTNMVGTGNPFTTPSIMEDVTYYVVRENYCAQTQAFEVNLTATPDTDGDGLCDDVDIDDDNDGRLDSFDNDPLNPFSCIDSDGDGCDDCSVTGADGSGGDPMNDGPDADGDGICDNNDAICVDTVLVHEIILFSDTVYATMNINSKDNIPAGSNISYLAGEDIDLVAGFRVDLGGEFYAGIGGICQGVMPAQSTVTSPMRIITTGQNIQIVKYTLDKVSDVTIQLFDNKGEVKALRYHATNVAAGTYEQMLNTAELHAGIYVCKITAGAESFTAKVYVKD